VNYYTKEELMCKKDGKPCPYCGGGFEIDDEFLKRANQARHYAGIPFDVNSCCRCGRRNEEVGGGKKSSHIFNIEKGIKTLAMDVDVKSAWHASKILNGLAEAGINRRFIYIKPTVVANNSFVLFHIHFDTDGEKPQDVFGVRTY